MDFYVIRSKRQLLELFDYLKGRHLPFKLAIQDIYTKRSVDLNDYIWGCLYTPIAKATGHDILEIHEAFKKRYNFRYDFIYDSKVKKYKLSLGVGSTTVLDYKECWDYAAKIRAEAELELHLTLQLPKEAFIPELDFEFENSNEIRRV